MPIDFTTPTIPFTWHTPEPVRPNPAARTLFAVPAKDEEDSIGGCIRALENQYNPSGKRIPWAEYEVLLLVNNTTDATVRRALDARRHPRLHIASVKLPARYAHIGWARRLAMEWCSERLRQGGRPKGVIVSTDADSRVAPDFLYQLHRLFTQPEVGAAGATLSVDEASSPVLSSSLHHYFVLEKQLRLKAQKRAAFDLIHPHFSGAGFAVRQMIYEAVGGLTPFPYNEDKQFYQKLLQKDVCVKMSDALRISTSDRTEGRTEWGMAAQLRQWQQTLESGGKVLVGSAQSHWAYFQLQMALYAYWLRQTEENLMGVCQYLCIYQVANPLPFLSAIDRLPYFGQYWCCVWEHPKMVEARQRTFPAVPVDDTLDQFNMLLALPDDGRVARRA